MRIQEKIGGEGGAGGEGSIWGRTYHLFFIVISIKIKIIVKIKMKNPKRASGSGKQGKGFRFSVWVLYASGQY